MKRSTSTSNGWSEVTMWHLTGHRTKNGYICDLCRRTLGSMDELIPHVHSHGVSRVEPVFLFGVVYGLMDEPAGTVHEEPA